MDKSNNINHIVKNDVLVETITKIVHLTKLVLERGITMDDLENNRLIFSKLCIDSKLCITDENINNIVKQINYIKQFNIIEINKSNQTIYNKPMIELKYKDCYYRFHNQMDYENCINNIIDKEYICEVKYYKGLGTMYTYTENSTI
jgi:hypothetical protein